MPNESDILLMLQNLLLSSGMKEQKSRNWGTNNNDGTLASGQHYGSIDDVPDISINGMYFGCVDRTIIA